MKKIDGLRSKIDVAALEMGAALDAYNSGQDGWQVGFSEALESVAWHIINSAPPPNWISITATMRLVADAFADAANGIEHPLFSVIPPKGRPKPNRVVRTQRRGMAAVAIFATEIGKRKGWNREESFRFAARKLVEHGWSVSWREMRSAHSNRIRLGDQERRMLEMHTAVAASAPIDVVEGILDQLALEAAGLLKSKTSLF